MKTAKVFFLAVVLSACAHSDDARLVADPAIDCGNCAEWNQPQAPFRIHGNTWYVGVAGLSAILIDSGEGLVLLDGGLPQSAPLIAENIRQLGFSLRDVSIIGLSHAHFDHAGGIRALQAASGARVIARKAARDALKTGDLMPDDPQYGMPGSEFPAVTDVDVVADRESIVLGDLELMVIATPGHSPGGTSWTWQSCEQDECLAIVYADSLSPVAAPTFRFRGAGKTAAAGIRRSARIIASLECDIFLAPHPPYFRMRRKLEQAGNGNAFVDNACDAYAEGALEQLQQRLLQEMRM